VVGGLVSPVYFFNMDALRKCGNTQGVPCDSASDMSSTPHAAGMEKVLERGQAEPGLEMAFLNT